MPDYLLPLSVLHAAAPGILDLIFGRDGEHDDAPHWEGQLWHFPLESYRTVSARRWTPDGLMLDLAFDLRLPSTAARIATICAQSLYHRPERVMGACVKRERHGSWSLLWRDADGYGKDAMWTADGKRCHVFDPDLSGAPFASPEAFLLALIMAYAPRIIAAKEKV